MLPLEPLRAVMLNVIHGLRHLMLAQDFVEDLADVDGWRHVVVDIVGKIFRGSTVGEVGA
jgi:hypothetical protein